MECAHSSFAMELQYAVTKKNGHAHAVYNALTVSPLAMHCTEPLWHDVPILLLLAILKTITQLKTQIKGTMQHVPILLCSRHLQVSSGYKQEVRMQQAVLSPPSAVKTTFDALFRATA